MAKPIVIVSTDASLADDTRASLKAAITAAFGGKVVALVASEGLRIEYIERSFPVAIAVGFFGAGMTAAAILIAVFAR